MTKQGIRIIIAGTLIVMAMFATAFMLLNPSKAFANPLFHNRKPLAAATSTITFMTAGTATTTGPTLDSYTSGITTGTQSAVLLVQFTASSTSSTLKWYYEYSEDGVDWYAGTQDSILTTQGTTTPQFIVQTPLELAWKFASTSVAGAVVSSTNNWASKAINVPTPTRYVRPVFYMALAGTNGGVWSEWVSSKELK